MTKFLLAVHVLAAIIAIGPITVAASMFPAVMRRALAAPPDPQAASWARLLHRICRVYAVVGVAVPVFGLATAGSLGVLTDAWLLTSMALTAAAALLLILVVLPRQAALTAALGEPATPGIPDSMAADIAGSPPAGAAGSPPAGAVGSVVAPGGRAIPRLAMATGMFNLLWAIVTVLMIVRPGSTTGV
ncbi:hypothetical protein J2S43_005242 [Catenuloplanes nepalensis]|uniref:Protease n=1 Tax=Catenuloplanes nepalensis TaxID=587533 RepID=A0ABT9MZ54_9ACTN|nr:hypothetical protein [Catenuloplanes nepalensis]MDP9796730.1 hypothetical protein [Catenuloplanes nepalensis]